jgi:hypothetical protein
MSNESMPHDVERLESKPPDLLEKIAREEQHAVYIKTIWPESVNPSNMARLIAEVKRLRAELEGLESRHYFSQKELDTSILVMPDKKEEK